MQPAFRLPHSCHSWPTGVGSRRHYVSDKEVHNHPSSDQTPSPGDIEMTRTVAKAIAAVGITLHDHVVIGRGKHASFKSLGLL